MSAVSNRNVGAWRAVGGHSYREKVDRAQITCFPILGTIYWGQVVMNGNLYCSLYEESPVLAAPLSQLHRNKVLHSPHHSYSPALLLEARFCHSHSLLLSAGYVTHGEV